MNGTNIGGGTLQQGVNPSTTNVVAAAFVAVLIILALGGNFIVCASFYTFRDLRTKCNYFIISLAISDILVALVAMPFWLTIQLTDNKWIYGQELKQVWDIIDILCGTASIMNLTAVSFDRQLAITSPFTYPKVMTSRRALYLIGFVWVYAATVAGVKLIRTDGVWPRPGYLAFAPIASFFLPLLVMIAMYARIYLVARYQAKRIGRNYATDIKAAKTIAVVIGGFIICWLPFFVIVIAFAISINSPIPMQFLNVAKWLEYLNSCLNPVIYTCLNRSYRRAFRKLFLRCRSKIMREHHVEQTSTWASVADSRAPTHLTRADSSYGPNSPPGSPRKVNGDLNENLLVNENLTVV